MNRPKLIDTIGQFTAVPNAAIKSIAEIGPEAFTLFVYFRYRTNSESEVAFPSYDTIQRDTNFHRRTISRAIWTLVQAGMLERQKRFGRSTLYMVKIPPTVVPPLELTVVPTVELTVVPPLELDIKTDPIKTDPIEIESSCAGAQKRQTSPRQQALSTLEGRFSSISHIPIPASKTPRERKAAAVRWWVPIADMWELCGRDTDRAVSLLELAYAKMVKDKLTISAPQSVLEVFKALYAEQARAREVKTAGAVATRRVYRAGQVVEVAA